jgi:hypothetical protein
LFHPFSSCFVEPKGDAQTILVASIEPCLDISQSYSTAQPSVEGKRKTRKESCWRCKRKRQKEGR